MVENKIRIKRTYDEAKELVDEIRFLMNAEQVIGDMFRNKKYGETGSSRGFYVKGADGYNHSLMGSSYDEATRKRYVLEQINILITDYVMGETKEEDKKETEDEDEW